MRTTALLILLSFSLVGCGDAYRYLYSGKVGWAIKHQVRDLQSKQIRLEALTEFQWDEVFLFGPYAPRRVVCQTLELVEPQCSSALKSESIDEGQVLMAFRQGQKTVYTELHFRFHGDFTPVRSVQPLAREKAVFAVVSDGTSFQEKPWFRLQQQ